MGLLDREYMRERAQERAREKNTPPGNRTMIMVLAGCTIIAAGQYYRSNSGHEPVRIGPLQMTTENGIRTDGSHASSPEAAVTPNDDSPIVPPDGLIMQETVPQAVPEPQAQAFPESGAVQWAKPPVAGEPLAMLRISDGSDLRGNKVVRLRDAFGDMLLQVYVRDQEGAIIQVPPGRYQINVMIGTSWYGLQEQFGQSAMYFRGRTMIVGSGGSDYLLMPIGTPGVSGMTNIPPSSF